MVLGDDVENVKAEYDTLSSLTRTRTHIHTHAMWYISFIHLCGAPAAPLFEWLLTSVWAVFVCAGGAEAGTVCTEKKK